MLIDTVNQLRADMSRTEELFDNEVGPRFNWTRNFLLVLAASQIAQWIVLVVYLWTR